MTEQIENSPSNYACGQSDKVRKNSVPTAFRLAAGELNKASN